MNGPRKYKIIGSASLRKNKSAMLVIGNPSRGVRSMLKGLGMLACQCNLRRLADCVQESVGILGIIVVIITGAAMGAVQRYRLGVPMTVGDDLIKTSLTIECEIENFDMPVSAFRSQPAGSLERTFATLVDAIGADDLNTAETYVDSKADRSYPRVTNPCAFLKLCLAGALPDMSNLRVRGHVYWGSNRFVLYEVVKPSSVLTSFLPFKKNQEGNWKWVPIPGDLETLLWTMLRYNKTSLSDPDQELLRKEYDYRFQVTPDPNDHPVFLLFNGHICDMTLPGQVGGVSDPVLAFYADAVTALVNSEGIDALRDVGNRYYDTQSRETFFGRLDKGYERFVQWRDEYLARQRTVVFLLDADPAYVVFYRRQGAPPRYISHEYILREGERFYLTRLALSDAVEGFLTNRTGFIEPVLLPILGGTEPSH
jgi:hypothetical protein